MICNERQIKHIIKMNPGKARIAEARLVADKMMLHLYGKRLKESLKHCDYFENKELYKVRQQYAVSNKDMFGRILEQEDMVFTAKGGSTYFNLPESDEKRMNALLEDVQHGLSLRKWIRDVARNAYRIDPMGVIFMEVDRLDMDSPAPPRTYPTYKSSYCIFDYEYSGRRLEWICFQLSVNEARSFNIQDEDLKDAEGMCESMFFRFVDDEKDVIYKLKGEEISEVADTRLENHWEKTPGFIVSDLQAFYDAKQFFSPLWLTVELADCFLEDRSVRDLQKKFHGFSKPVEPLFDCDTCNGEGYVEGQTCADCKGTKIKRRTRVSDVARFPVDIFKEAGFDFKKIFGYVSPDVEGWEKQDASLKDLEAMIDITYWGARNDAAATNGPKSGDLEETATKTLANLRPRYARLNRTADWAESTENMVAEFIGSFWFDGFKKSSISYGRYYILETPSELWAQYEGMRRSGAPVATLYEAIEKYYHSLYQTSPIELAVRLKLLYVEPFPHLSISETKNLVTDFADYNSKLYFGEWYSSLTDIEVVVTKTDALREALRAYVARKGLKEPKPEPVNQN